MAPKPGSPPCPGSSMEDTYLPSMRGPAFRRHDSYPGFRTELESLVGDDKGKSTSGRTTRLKVPMRQPESHCSIIARKRSNGRGAKGAGHPRQEGVNGQPEELLPWRKPGGASLGWHEPDESRDSRPDLWETRGEIPRVYPAQRVTVVPTATLNVRNSDDLENSSRIKSLCGADSDKPTHRISWGRPLRYASGMLAA